MNDNELEKLNELEKQARALVRSIQNMRSDEAERRRDDYISKLPIPNQVMYRKGDHTSPAIAVKFAIEYVKWSASVEGKAYIAIHGDPYAREKENEIEATEWFAEREAFARDQFSKWSEGEEGRKYRGLVSEDVRPIMIFREDKAV
jgi:hypothetical protein